MINLDNFLAINQKNRVETSKLSPRGLPTRPPKNSSSLIWLAESKWGFRIGFWKFKSLIFKSLILNIKVQVWPFWVTAIAGFANHVTLLNGLANSNPNFIQVTIQCPYSITMIDHNHVSVTVGVLGAVGNFNRTTGRGMYWCSNGRADIYAGM